IGRLVGTSQWAGTQDVGKKQIDVRHSHKGRQRWIVGSTKMSGHGTHGRMGANVRIELAPLGLWVARLHGCREVIGAGAAVDRTNDRQAIHDVGLTGELIRDVYAGDPRRYRAERSAKLARCVRFGVPGIKLAWSARQPYEDDGLAVVSGGIQCPR